MKNGNELYNGHGVSITAEYNRIFHSEYKSCAIIVDPNRKDSPIISATAGFFDVTKYQAWEIIGKNCRILQGKSSCRIQIEKMRDAVAERAEASIEIINYSKYGEKYLNDMRIIPLFKDDGSLKLFAGYQIFKPVIREKRLLAKYYVH